MLNFSLFPSFLSLCSFFLFVYLCDFQTCHYCLISLKWLQISLGWFSKIRPEICFTGITKLNSLIQAKIVSVNCFAESIK